jgi:hypothetical protein
MVGLVTIAASTYMITYSHQLFALFEPLLGVFERKGTPREPTEAGAHRGRSFPVIIFETQDLGFVDAINFAFEKYKSLVSKGESQLFDKKRQQPGLPEGSGPAATTPEPITSNNVAQIARERLEKEKQLLG